MKYTLLNASNANLCTPVPQTLITYDPLTLLTNLFISFEGLFRQLLFLSLLFSVRPEAATFLNVAQQAKLRVGTFSEMNHLHL